MPLTKLDTTPALIVIDAAVMFKLAAIRYLLRSPCSNAASRVQQRPSGKEEQHKNQKRIMLYSILGRDDVTEHRLAHPR
jgi:hypothetical protein